MYHMMTGIVYIWKNFYYIQSVQYNCIKNLFHNTGLKLAKIVQAAAVGTNEHVHADDLVEGSFTLVLSPLVLATSFLILASFGILEEISEIAITSPQSRMGCSCCRREKKA